MFQPNPVKHATLLTLAFALFIPVTTFAGSVSIEHEHGALQQYGNWELEFPNGSSMNSHREERVKSFTDIPEGTYTLAVRPPYGANPEIVIHQGFETGVFTKNKVEFTVEDGAETHVDIAYNYAGVIHIKSTIAGQEFYIESPDDDYNFTGKTPATIEDLPPLAYTLSFTESLGCMNPVSIRKTLAPRGTVSFYAREACEDVHEDGVYVDENQAHALHIGIIEERGLQTQKHAHLSIDVRQKEVLPGGMVRATINIENTSIYTLHALRLTHDAKNGLHINPIDNAATVSDNTVHWTLPVLLPGEVWQTTVRISVPENTQPGQTLNLLARLQGAGGNTQPHIDTASETFVLVANLPEVGARIDHLVMILVAGAGLILSILTNRRKQYVVQIGK